MNSNVTRRVAVKAMVAAGAVGCFPSMIAADPVDATGRLDASRSSDGRRVLRLAHLTDVHVQPELRADAGLIACLHHVQQNADPPQLLLTGGDHIMDAFASDASRTRLQWDLYTRILKAECSLLIEPCLGNRDIWGWDRKSSRTTGDEPRYGKKWAMEMLGIAAPYRSFERAGWKFIVLDNVQPDVEGFRGELDPPQFDWLREELKRTPRETPILILSHIPILSSTVFLAIRSAEENGKEWKIPAIAMHMDARKLIALFAEHPNVRLCLSGHTHLLDRVEYGSVTYICDGAVCGGFWRGPNQRTAEGYGLIDLLDDGSFKHQYINYGWQAAGG